MKGASGAPVGGGASKNGVELRSCLSAWAESKESERDWRGFPVPKPEPEKPRFLVVLGSLGRLEQEAVSGRNGTPDRRQDPEWEQIWVL